MRSWIDRYWVGWSVGVAVFMGLYGWGLFGDLRAGVAGAVVSGGLSAWLWRPGGPGHRFRRREDEREREREAAGVPLVRPGCAIGMVAVLVVVLLLALVGVLVTD